MSLQMPNRRDTLKLGLAAAAAGAAWPALAQGAPIRIGAVLPISGPLAVMSRDVLMGAEIAVEQINASGGLLGRRVELVVRDDKSNPTETLAAVREFTGSGINLTVGGILFNAVLAAIPTLEQSNAVMVTTGTIGMSLTHEKFSRNVFRANTNDYVQMRAMADFAAQRYPDIGKWACVSLDSEALLTSWEIFKHEARAAYTRAGKKIEFVDAAIKAKFGSGDFRNQIAAVMSSGAGGLLSLIFGQDGITFYQQARPFGMAQKLSAIIDRGNEYPFAKALRQSIPENFWLITAWYAPLYDKVATSSSLFKAAVDRTKDPMPSGYVNNGHGPVMALAAAVRHAKSTDTEQVIKALETIRFETALGQTGYRKEDHQVIADINLIRIAPGDGNTPFKVNDSLRIPTENLLEPATPGTAFKL